MTSPLFEVILLVKLSPVMLFAYFVDALRTIIPTLFPVTTLVFIVESALANGSLLCLELEWCPS